MTKESHTKRLSFSLREGSLFGFLRENFSTCTNATDLQKLSYCMYTNHYHMPRRTGSSNGGHCCTASGHIKELSSFQFLPSAPSKQSNPSNLTESNWNSSSSSVEKPLELWESSSRDEPRRREEESRAAESQIGRGSGGVAGATRGLPRLGPSVWPAWPIGCIGCGVQLSAGRTPSPSPLQP